MGKSIHSIIYRITGLMFLTVALTVLLLVFLANAQMTDLFQQYLVVQHMGMNPHLVPPEDGQMITVIMGAPEHTFLSSVHQSLIWVGAAILLVGLLASYALARSITIPLQKLSRAAEQIEQGNFKQIVPVDSQDEVGHLAEIFNRMADTLAVNTNLRRQFLANVAHELKTPLAIIQGHLEGMLDDVIEMNKEQVASLHEEAIRLNRLIKDLRDLSLAEVGQLTLEKQLADINQLVGRAVQMLRPSAEAKGIAVECVLDESLPELTVDADRLSQVFYNLLVNAIRYTPDHGTVNITSEITQVEKRAWLTVLIKDNGAGIDSEDIPYVFDHFYRGEKSRNRKLGGSGLGLAIVKQLVENHGGRVSVSSQLGIGSVFQVRFPLEKAL